LGGGRAGGAHRGREGWGGILFLCAGQDGVGSKSAKRGKERGRRGKKKTGGGVARFSPEETYPGHPAGEGSKTQGRDIKSSEK